MGTTTKRFIVKETRKSKKKIEIDFLIDSGAVYSLVPAAMLKKIGIESYKTVEFILADGTKIERKVGDAYFEYEGEGGTASVIFRENAPCWRSFVTSAHCYYYFPKLRTYA